LAVVGVSWVWARRAGRRNLAILAVCASALWISGCIVVAPAGGRFVSWIALGGLTGLNLGACCLPASLERRLLALARSQAAKITFTILAASVIPLAVAERTCRVLTEAGVLKYHRAIQTVKQPGNDDWRLATITGDETREPDPILLWRPVPHRPFNSQRFKGPLAQVPKPTAVVRVMCYGDSLTDGPPKGGWPTWLHALLSQEPPAPARRFEVINAGVAGYSSHQGLLRFLQEVDRYDPDLLLVSFGWNDAAEAIGQPDKSFRIPPWPLVVCQRALIRYRSYLVLMYYTRRSGPEQPLAPSGPANPRVSVDDYLANLDRFRAEALARGIPIVFLTRPHKLAPAELRKNPSWRGSVPRYNASLCDWAKTRDVPVIDVQKHFEQLSPALFADECHLSREGYQQMGELVRDYLVTRQDGWEPQDWLASRRPSVDGVAVVRSPREGVGDPSATKR
jgi:lysophospholipase L1-like esterase